MHDEFEDSQIKHWAARIKKEPELAGWFIDFAQMHEEADVNNHPLYKAIARNLELEFSDIDFKTIDPYEVISRLVKMRRNKAYDWSKFERPRARAPNPLFPNRFS